MHETTIAVSRLHSQKPVPGTDMFVQYYDIVNMPGMSAIWVGRIVEGADPIDYETVEQAWVYRDQEFATLEEATAAWNAEQVHQMVRDRTGEALRRLVHGLIRPLWADMTEEVREDWRFKADILIRLLANFGVQLQLGERANGRR